MSIRRVAAPMTYPLRRTVLRKGIEHTDVRFPQDDMPDTFHLGYFVADELVGVAPINTPPTPQPPDAHPWQHPACRTCDATSGRSRPRGCRSW